MNKDSYGEKQKRWDKYFHTMCEATSSKSPCLSRQIGAILVRDNSIISTGFNGPAKGYPHCEAVRVGMPDISTANEIHTEKVCPRRAKGFKSGEGLELCPAAHAEVNSISNAAKLGVSTLGSTLYMNCIVPCKDCATHIVNTGIVEVVVDELKYYHEMAGDILNHACVKVRKFRR